MARFRLLVSPITTSAIDVSTLLKLGEAMDGALRSKGESIELSGIVLFPIVTEKSIYPRADFITHKRGSKAYYVGRNIDFGSWKRARTPGRIHMAFRNFEACINSIPDRRLSLKSKGAILRELKRAAARVANGAKARAA